MGMAVILNGEYHCGLSAPELAKICQYAENTYFGKPSGLLDQLTSAVGGVIFADFADPASPKIEKIHAAFVRGYSYFERDILAPRLEKYNVRAYKYEGYYARICGLKSYFDENMKLLDDENLEALFTGGPVYTKIRDDNPTRYITGCKAKNNLVADGCVIEGDVENCILFRGVKIEKGAKIRNSVLMQDTVVKAGGRLDYVVTDKNVTIEVGQELKGTDTQPFYVAKGHTV